MKTYDSNPKPILASILALLTILGIHITSYADITPVSDRTEEVRDAIVAEVGAPNASDVTEADLALITHLVLRGAGITALESGDFSGMTSLEHLYLHSNRLSSLPDGIFEGLTALEFLNLSGNTVDPMPITVSLEKGAEGEFKVVVPTGAPFEIVVPISVTNGSISAVTGAPITTLTISTGTVESGTATVTRTADTTDAVSTNIGRLPSIPLNHYGYVLSKSDTLPLEVISAIPENAASVAIPENAAPVFTDGTDTTRTIAENSDAGVNIGTTVAATDADDDTLTYSLGGTHASPFDIDSSSGQLLTSAALDFETQSSYSVTVSASDGNDGSASITVTITVTDALDATPLNERTPKVKNAILNKLGLTDPAAVNDAHLASIRNLNISDSNIRSLNADDFDGLSALRNINLELNDIRNLPADIFDGLSELRKIDLRSNDIRNPPADVFDGLSAVTEIDLGQNDIRSLPEDVFDGLSELSILYLNSNKLTSLPADVFDGLSKLSRIDLDNNRLTSLPADVFDGLSKLRHIGLRFNDLTSLPTGLFDGLSLLGFFVVADNPGAPFGITVSLEKVTEGEFKAKADPGAPFNIVLRVAATNGSIDDGTTRITIRKGKTESDTTLTVNRTGVGTPDPTTVDIGTLPSVDSIKYNGLALVKSSDLPLEINTGTEVPVFTDGTDTTRSIAENSNAGVNIGSTVAATDADDDTLTYSLGGTDASFFDIDSSSGQLKTSAVLDFEIQSSYSVIVAVSDDNGGSASITVTITVTDTLDATPLSARTHQVRVALLQAIPDIFDTVDITDAHLAAITTLDLSEDSITSLTNGDFSGLSSLETLILDGNSLSSLPANIFDGLSALTALQLQGNSLTSLPANIFDGLSALNALTLNDNSLSNLRANVFGGLTSLTVLNLNNNSLTGLWSGIFGGLSSLTHLHLNNNSLSNLPDGAFSDLTSLTHLDLQGNALDPVPITVSLEKVGTDKFKAIIPTGAPFDVVVPVSATNGIIRRSETTITIPKGSLESDTTLTVKRTDDSTFHAVTADIGTLPTIPSSHSGYSLVKSDDLPVEVIDAINQPAAFTDGNRTTRSVAENTASATNIGDPVAATDLNTDDTLTYTLGGTDASTFRINSSTGQLKTRDALDYETKHSYSVRVTVSDGNGGSDRINVTINVTDVLEATALSERTSEVVSAIEAAVPGDATGADITDTQLAAITTLDISEASITSLQNEDFTGLTGLRTLNLSQNSLSSLPEDIFDGLSSLRTLDLSDNSVSSLPADVFDGLSSLRTLDLSDNSVSSIRSDVFDGLSSLRTLNLSDNSLASLPSHLVFNDLSSLVTLDLSDNSVSSLTADIFDGLSSLKKLYLQNNTLASPNHPLPYRIFEGLTSLTTLKLQGNTTDPVTFTLSLEKISDGTFKAKFPEGAPFDIWVTISLSANAMDPPRHTTLIDTGDINNLYNFSASRKANTTGAVTADINVFTNVPDDHSGYTIVKNSNLPIEVIPAVPGAPTLLPDATSFLSNYPNPFNPETWIPYHLAKPADVRLTIYDMRGVVVRELVLGHQAAGFYTNRSRAAHWDGRNDFGEKVATGIYFCTFEAGDFTATRKMLIRK